MKNYTIARLNRIATFGHMNTGYNSAGVPVDEFVAEFTKHAGDYNFTVNQRMSAVKSDLITDRALAVRHDPRLQNPKQTLYCQVDGMTYKVATVTADTDINAFDLVSLTVKDGKTNDEG